MNDKLFGKYHDIVLLFLGFALTTIVGTVIADHFQNKNWEYQNRRELEDRERVRAELVFSEISSLLDERLWKTRRLYWAKTEYNNINEDSYARRVHEREVDYDGTLTKWNSNLNKNEQLLSRYFGKPARDYFDKEVLNRYIELDILIRKLNRGSSAKNDIIDAKIRNLNLIVSKFDRLMLDAIKKNNIGVFNTKSIFTTK